MHAHTQRTAPYKKLFKTEAPQAYSFIRKQNSSSLKKLAHTLWQPDTSSPYSSPLGSPPAEVVDPRFGVRDGVHFITPRSSPEKRCEELATADKKRISSAPGLDWMSAPTSQRSWFNGWFSPHPSHRHSGSASTLPADQRDRVFSDILLDAVKSLVNQNFVHCDLWLQQRNMQRMPNLPPESTST